jgi:type IV pilus assembly protein PilB
VTTLPGTDVADPDDLAALEPVPPPNGRDAERPDPGRRQRLGDLLVAAGVLDRAALEDALGAAASGERLGRTVLRLELVTEEELADAVASQLRLPRVDIEQEVIETEAVDRLPERLAVRHGVLPLRFEDGALVVATTDPSDLVALDDVRLAAGVRSVRPVVAVATPLERARSRAYAADGASDVLQGLDVEPATDPQDDLDDAADDQPVIRLVDALLVDAITGRASDVHLEPDGAGLRVRFRVDGLLREATRVPRSLAPQVLSRVKIMARLDIAERRLPQDGRAVVRVDGQPVDLRVSTMPTQHGETVVLRVLPKDAAHVDLADLGHRHDLRDRFLTALARPQGLVLVTGPTGSGKTTTLYAGLAAVADPTRNVITLEDPVEVQLPGVNQTQIEHKIGLTFARGLRHVLRQDPDVVLVGEIRDRETAQLAVEASFTGHLVLATLHTNDAPSAVARLVDLGADPFLIASSLLLVVAQRLARTVCPRCAEPDPARPETVRALGLDPSSLADADLRRGGGCHACDGSGSHGRVALGEVLTATPRLRELVVDRAPETVLSRQARLEGLRTLREDAIGRAREGRITLEEALRVTPDAAVDVARCPSCETVVADDHVACPMCGTGLAGGHCGGCGRAVDAAWRTCPWCRHGLVQGG